MKFCSTVSQIILILVALIKQIRCGKTSGFSTQWAKGSKNTLIRKNTLNLFINVHIFHIHNIVL